MSCNLNHFSNYLSNLLQFSAFDDAALNGIQVEGHDKIHSFATAVSPSLAAIEKAAENKVDLLLCHHGILWKQSGPEPITGAIKNKLKKLLGHNITLFVCHLPLDAHKEFGNNFPVARAMNWTSLEPFDVGVKATFPPMHRGDLQVKLENYYGRACQQALGGNELVSSCVIISGNGHKKIHDVSRLNIDCLVTGSVDEPIWHAAFEEKVNFFAFGHATTEKVGVQLLGDHLRNYFQIPHIFIDEPNPF